MPCTSSDLLSGLRRFDTGACIFVDMVGSWNLRWGMQDVLGVYVNQRSQWGFGWTTFSNGGNEALGYGPEKRERQMKLFGRVV